MRCKDGVPVRLGWSVGEMRLARISRLRGVVLDAVVEVVYERGVAGTSVGLVCERARVSRRMFYECFEGLDSCLVAVLDGALERAAPLVVDAFTEGGSWQDGMRSVLAEMLAFFDEEPALAQVCLVELGTAAPVVREHRERILGAFGGLVVERVGSEVSHASPLAAEGMYASVVGIVNARLVAREPQPPLIGLLGPLMGIIVGPFMDKAGVAEEIERADRLAREMLERRASETAVDGGGEVEVPGVLLAPRAHRVRACLLYVAAHPGASNQEVAGGIGVLHGGQVSALLGRLAGLGLVCKRAGGPGYSNAWSLSPEGERVALVLAQRR
jgi:AcrR family transcriptional regulator